MYLDKEYQGGELHLCGTGVVLKPTTGKALVFKQFTYGIKHRVVKVVSCVKHVLRADVMFENTDLINGTVQSDLSQSG
jgi:hypothetical protein